MSVYVSASAAETEQYGIRLASELAPGSVVALFGGLGMGKTAMVRGIAAVLSPDAEVSSPTFALVHDYGGNPRLVHFDMYRVNDWNDLYSTGYFDYLEEKAVLVIEWSENIESALPDGAIRIYLTPVDEHTRRIERK